MQIDKKLSGMEKALNKNAIGINGEDIEHTLHKYIKSKMAIYSYDISHKRLILYMESSFHKEILYIFIAGVSYISGFTKIENIIPQIVFNDENTTFKDKEGNLCITGNGGISLMLLDKSQGLME